MDYFENVKEFVKQEFEEAGREDHIRHLQRTVHWIKELEEDPSEALLIAGYAHDADHAERWKNREQDESGVKKIDFTGEERLEKHQKRGAEIVGNYLEQQNAPEELVSRVKELISRHEFGGNREQDILKDADSLSFFENNVDGFLDKVGVKFRKEDVREKFNWMYDRISSEEAREIAEPWYEESVDRLDSLTPD